ncbi:Hypothetical predicted protein, partial [Cloeon dipterum]
KKKCLDMQGREREFENLKVVFPMLLSPRTRYIELNSILSFCPDWFTDSNVDKVTPCGVFEKYLTIYGQKLQSLYLGYDGADLKIDYKLILKYCSKLEKLSLFNVLLKMPLSKIEFFAELKELEWTNLKYIYRYDNTPDGIPDPESTNLLSKILSAPKLEKVKLDSSVFKENDLCKLNSLIQENRILNNLNTLHVYFKYDIDDALANVLKSACAYLPKLTDFKFGRRHKFDDPLLPIQSTPLSDIDASVCEMISVFENEK